MQLRLGHPTRQALLLVATALVVILVRAGLHPSFPAGDTGWWASVENLLVGWFIHTVALLLLVAIAAALIVRFHRLFLGHPAPWPDGSFDDVTFYVLMTVLVATVSIYVVANATPSFDD
jgi:hypothetical protein